VNSAKHRIAIADKTITVTVTTSRVGRQDVYCGQTVSWIRMPLGTEVGLGLVSKLRRTPILRRGIGNLRISNVGMGILRKRCLRVRKQRNGRLSLR